MVKTYTSCKYSQEITENSTMCCSGNITICACCEKKLCEHHADQFSHLLTCRTPKENEELMRKYGLID